MGAIDQVSNCVEYNAVCITREILSAVDKLIKVQYMLNMAYGLECAHVLHYLQRAVLGLTDELPLSRSASDLSLFVRNKLRHV